MRMNEASDRASKIREDIVAKAVGVCLVLILHCDESIPMLLPLVSSLMDSLFLRSKWVNGEGGNLIDQGLQRMETLYKEVSE